jgi:hypothetical protein
MLDMHTPLSLNLRQWFSIGVVTYLLTKTTQSLVQVYPLRRDPLVTAKQIAWMTDPLAITILLSVTNTTKLTWERYHKETHGCRIVHVTCCMTQASIVNFE